MSAVLKNETYKQYNYLSRYSQFPYYYNSNDDKYIYGITSYLDDTIPYELYKTSQGQTLDELALVAYNDPCKYWIIADFNRIQNPIIHFDAGEEIKIPSISNIRFK